MANIRPGKANFGPESAYFRPEKADLGRGRGGWKKEDEMYLGGIFLFCLAIRWFAL